MTLFTSNYPHFESGNITLLPTPQRMGALSEYTGRGVVIAFVDSGFYMHPDLDGRVLLHADASTHHVVEAPRVEYASDLSWHGQMTSVIAAGDGRASGGRYRGIASGAHVVLVKVSTPRGLIKEADILRGLRWVYDTRHKTGVRVVNVSVGGDFVSSDPQHPLYRLTRRLVDAGIVVLAAAGNRGVEKLVPPASAPPVLTIGGYNDHNTLDRHAWTQYHNDYGVAYDGTPKPEVSAPAAWIASPILPHSLMDREARWLASLLSHPLLSHGDADALRHWLHQAHHDLGIPRERSERLDDALRQQLQARINSHKLIDAHHQHVDGTSVAAAIASSVVAQMLEANPALTPAQVRAFLMDTAQPLPGMPQRQGAGRIDAAAAVRRAEASARKAAS